MILRYEWNEEQTAVIAALKETLAAPADLNLSWKSFLAMEDIFLGFLRENGVQCHFFDCWKHFRQTDYSQSFRSDEQDRQYNFWFCVLCQAAAALFTPADPRGWADGENLKELQWFFTQKVNLSHFGLLPESLGSFPGLHEAVCLNDVPQKALDAYLKHAESRIARRSVRNYLLNNRKYDLLMLLDKAVPCLDFDSDCTICELHFLSPNGTKGKDHYNKLYLKHLGQIAPDIWKKHYETGNLEYVLLPLLKRGADPDWFLCETDSLKITLRDYCCFIGEITEELSKLVCWNSAVCCANIFNDYLESLRPEGSPKR